MYLMLVRSRPPGFGDIPAIPLTEVEALYRMEKLSEFLPAREFIAYVQFLDDVFREWYRTHKKKA